MLPVRTLRPVRVPAYATYGLIVLNGLFFLWQLTLPAPELRRAWLDYAAVPCVVASTPLAPATWLDILRSMFYHTGWAHLVGNMTFLWIFGRNVEEYFGARRFLGLYVLSGFAAALLESFIRYDLCGVPLVGASGAIAGVLGSYLILYPGTRVKVLIIFFRFFPAFYNIPAVIVLGYWFLLQLFNGVASLGVETLGGGVAFFAHIGGFALGLVVTFIYLMFNPPPDRTIYTD